MITARIVESEKRIHVDVSGYITSNDAKKFIGEYKQMTRSIKSSQYKLVVIPSVFECESKEDLRTVCMSFYKSSYRSMYLVDPNNYIMSIMSLGPIEKRMFLKVVKIVSRKEDVR